MKKCKFLDFNEARDFVRGLGLKNYEQWHNYSITEKPKNIPKCPNAVYRSKWLGFPDWMGYKYVLNVSGLDQRKYTVNNSYFKKWSHDMAYVLGFWFADGCIYGNEFSISQHKKDSYILEEILKIMGATYKVKGCGKNVVIINIRSKEIVDDVKTLGGKERKSLDVLFPDVPKEYLSDFIRGYFDGDGCVYYMKSRNGFLSNFSTGSQKFAYGLLEAIRKSIPVHGSICRIIHKKGEKACNGRTLKKDSVVYSVRFSYNDTKRLRDFMYFNEGIKLHRKYQLLKKAGEIKIIKSGFLSYSEAREKVCILGLRSYNDWVENYCLKGLRPLNIPYSPDRSYKNKGWISWKDFLGYDKIRKKGG